MIFLTTSLSVAYYLLGKDTWLTEIFLNEANYLFTQRTSLKITYTEQFIDFEDGLQIRTKYFDFFFQFLIAFVLLFMVTREFSLKAAV